jgi:hypothetical protein
VDAHTFTNTSRKSLNKRCLAARKLIYCNCFLKRGSAPWVRVRERVFWDRKGVIRVEFVQQGTTISQVYCETLKKLRTAIQNESGMLTATVVLLHNNERSISTGSCLTTLLTVLILLRATTICLTTRWIG